MPTGTNVLSKFSQVSMIRSEVRIGFDLSGDSIRERRLLAAGQQSTCIVSADLKTLLLYPPPSLPLSHHSAQAPRQTSPLTQQSTVANEAATIAWSTVYTTDARIRSVCYVLCGPWLRGSCKLRDAFIVAHFAATRVSNRNG